jgi:hypothetical protein
MIIDIEDVDDYGEAIDLAERRLMAARIRRDAAMTVIEASRRAWLGGNLPRNTYNAFKLIHGLAEEEVERQRMTLSAYSDFHFGCLTSAWMKAQCEMKATKPTRAQVWQRWRDVLAARKAYADLYVIVPQPEPEHQWTNAWGADVPYVCVGTRRERVEATAARDCAEGLYDCVLRAYEGRAPLTIDQLIALTSARVRAPKFPPPSGGKGKRKPGAVRSSYIGA